MNLQCLITFILCFSFLSCKKKAPDPSGFNPDTTTVKIPADILRTKGRDVVDGYGTKILLKGIAFGNEVWVNTPIPDKHHNEQDFERVAAMGMNTIRFYLNYKTFEDDAAPYQYKKSGWEWIDKNIEWARQHKIYLILNMHVPQGGFQSLGQGDGLWNNLENQKRLKALWYNIAKRYATEPVIAGYDLVNEPVVPSSIDQWKNFAQQITDSIRHADKNHMVIVERVNAVNGNWSSNSNNNFFLINDNNVMYTFHFYQPMEYSHQYASWIGFGEGGTYPDNSKPESSGTSTWYTAIFNNPRCPAGNSDWTYYEGIKFKIVDPKIKLGKPALAAQKNSGKVYFDDVVIKEFDESGNYVRDIVNLNMNQSEGFYFWSQNNSGSGGFDKQTGHNDKTSYYISNTTSDANSSGYKYLFIPRQGYYYSISGWMKGVDIPSEANCMLRIDFETSNDEILTRNKNYLKTQLNSYLKFSTENNVPLFLGEFGLMKPCFEGNRGGLIWVEDMLDLLKENRIHFTYHVYHEDNFGLYYGPGSIPVNPNNGNHGLIDLFSRKLN